MALPLSALAYLELTLEAHGSTVLLQAFVIHLQYDPSATPETFMLMMSFISSAGAVVYHLLYPILLVLQALLTVFLFVAAPFIHLGHYIAYACWWPFHILAKFETLYIFFGVAALVGIATGTGLHYASGFLASVLKIDIRTEEQQARSIAEYRASRQEQLEKEARLPMLPQVALSQPKVGGAMKEEYSDWLRQDKGLQGKKGVIPSTILEEDDSSDGF